METKKPSRNIGKALSGKRDSNSRPRPWQGRALPAELFPQLCLLFKTVVLRFAAAKISPTNPDRQMFFEKIFLNLLNPATVPSFLKTTAGKTAPSFTKVTAGKTATAHCHFPPPLSLPLIFFSNKNKFPAGCAPGYRCCCGGIR